MAVKYVEQDPEERKKRLKRLAAALAQKGLDPNKAVRAVPRLVEAALSNDVLPGSAELGRKFVEYRRTIDDENRFRRTFDPQPNRVGSISNFPSMRTNLPDPRWDALFGALQVAELQAGSRGQGFRVDYGNFGNDAEETYSPPGYEYKPFDQEFVPTRRNIRQRILDPNAAEAARRVGAWQAANRRRR